MSFVHTKSACDFLQYKTDKIIHSPNMTFAHKVWLPFDFHKSLNINQAHKAEEFSFVWETVSSHHALFAGVYREL